MNFLSHYYFDRANNNPYEVVGMVLPDLLKNADKSWNAHPERNEHLFTDEYQLALLKGWKRHLAVDQLFHDSNFFKHHQHQIKLRIKENIEGSPVKPFFLGHISLELILDNLLMAHQMINVDQFYKHLELVENHILKEFLLLNGINDVDRFFHFFELFKKEKYLFSYINPEKITYALTRICMRLWKNPFTVDQETALTFALLEYKKNLSKEFTFIFEMIDAQIN